MAAAGGYNDLTSSKMGNGASAKGAAPGAVPRASRQQVHTIRNAMAESYSSKGESSWAACCHLSVGECWTGSRVVPVVVGKARLPE